MDTTQFIMQNRTADVRRLALQAGRHPGVDMPFALDQIAGWQTARRKLPSWAACPGIVYPPHISMEQCSSEPAARYKAALARRWVRIAAPEWAETSMADLTGGFGVDFSFTSREFASALYVERDERLCATVRANLPRLGIANAAVECAEAAEMLAGLPGQTMIFLDPARRDGSGGKTVFISDCTPDVCSLLPQLMQKARFVMVKLSPMLDWHKAVADLGGAVREVHIVSVGGECKELLLVLSASVGAEGGMRVACADISAKPDGGGNYPQSTFEYVEGGEESDLPSCASSAASECGSSADNAIPDSEILHRRAQSENNSTFHIPHSKYLYEPNASVMKAGCFAQLSRRFGVQAVSRNSHLFLSAVPVSGFPGRGFAIRRVCTMNKKQLRAALAGVTHANVAVRNFPLSADALRKRLKLKDGGSAYIFATTTGEGEHVLVIGEKLNVEC